MPGFRFITFPGLYAQRLVYGAKDWPSLAILDVESDGTLTLFPTAWGELPAPLTGERISFASLAEVEGFLGLQREDIAA